MERQETYENVKVNIYGERDENMTEKVQCQAKQGQKIILRYIYDDEINK